MPDVTCIGELIVDLVARERGPLASVSEFGRYAGGASANVAVGLARLGLRTAFVGKVGNDPFGKFLKKQLLASGVNTDDLIVDPRHRTRLAFVTLDDEGDREFEFWERVPADEQLSARDISVKRLLSSRIVHISSFLLLHEPSRSTALNVAAALYRKNVLISFDPNIRLSLWDSVEEMRAEMRRVLKYTSILRLNEEEAFQVTGARTVDSAARRLLDMGPLIVVITRGSHGCCAYTGEIAVTVEGFPVDASDTTGCGDGFLAGMLYAMIRSPQLIETLDPASLTEICRFANAVGALTATRGGVIPALPKLSEVKALLRSKGER